MVQNNAAEAVQTVNRRLRVSPQIVDELIKSFNLVPWQSRLLRDAVSDRGILEYLHPYGSWAISTISEMGNEYVMSSEGTAYSFQDMMCAITERWDDLSLQEKMYLVTILGGQRKASTLCWVFEELSWMAEIENDDNICTESPELEEFLSGFRIITEG